jgi:hypothetical protein
MTRTMPRRLMILQRSQRFFTDADTFTVYLLPAGSPALPVNAAAGFFTPGSYVRNR